MQKYCILRFISLFLAVFFWNCEDPRPTLDPKVQETSLPRSEVLPFFRGEFLDPYWPNGEERPNDLKVLSLERLQSHKKDWIDNSFLRGKNKLIVFFFTKCNGVCPMITSNLVKFLPQLEPSNELYVLSFTVDPENDSIEKLVAYRKLFKITNPNWLFVTGDRKQIYDLARNVFSADVKFIQGKYDLQDFVHTENIYLVDKENFLRGVYRAKGTGDLERLKRDWKLLNSKI